MNNNILSISKFPDELVSNEEKKKSDYGRKYAMAMWAEWQNRFSLRAKHIEKLRKYAKGEQDVSDCKKNISREYTDIKYWEVDWEDKLNILPILLRNYWNTVDMNELQPVVKAIDPTALEFKAKRKDHKLKLFYAKDFIEQASQLNGSQIPLEFQNIPQSKEQIELEEQTAEPLKIEKAESLVMEAVAKENHFHLIQDDTLKEMVITNYGISKVTTCPIKGVKIDPVKIENFIHGKTNNRYFSDCPYYGEVKYLTAGQILRIAKQNKINITKEDVRKMAYLGSVEQLTDHHEIRVLFYAFKTSFEETNIIKKTYSKRAGKHTNAIKLINKDEYKPRSENDKPQEITDSYDVWFEGIMVLNAERTVIQHKLMTNLAENKANGSIIPPYIVCKPREKSIVEEIIPRINSLQELRYRILHFRNTLKGAITNLDPDMIANVTIGNDKLKPVEVLSMFFTKGIRFIKTVDEDGEPINRGANISESDTPIPRALIELSQQFITEIQLLNQSFGATQYDQANPDPKTLGEMEMYRFSPNTSLRDYTNAIYQWSIMVYQSISCRINDAIQWKNVREKFVSAIGTDDVETIEALKNRKNHYFGVYTDLIPTAEERINLQKRLEGYVNNGILTPLDEARITNTRNRTQALALLNLIIMAKQKEMAEAEKSKYDAQINMNAQSAIIAQEQKRISMQMEYELKEKANAIEFERKIFMQQKEGELKIAEAQVRNQGRLTTEEWARKYKQDADLAKKEIDKQTRLEAIQKSKELESELIRQRKGQSDGIYPQDTKQAHEVNLAQLNNPAEYSANEQSINNQQPNTNNQIL